MQMIGSKILSVSKYIYLIVFFSLLSGVFYPLIEKGTSANSVVIGVLILFFGLAGAVLVYKASTSEKRQKPYLIAGFSILAIALLLIFAVTGRL
ncbi:MAG: hypothetical protein HY295_06830 [Thaumarchaeota archaeon]|nr:hypothetical protein [Nitrososphaerota archaeon]